MVDLGKDTIHIGTSLADNGDERWVDAVQVKLVRVLNLHQAVVLIVFDDALARSILKESGVRKDQFATFEFGRIRWDQVLHKPVELLMTYIDVVPLYVPLHRIDHRLDILDSSGLHLELAGDAVSATEEVALGTVDFEELVAVGVV